jgi:serine/threonine protein kinase
LVQEILILQKIDHPNIVKLLEIYRTNTHFFIVMEYLDDEEMYYFIKNNFEIVSKYIGVNGLGKEEN